MLFASGRPAFGMHVRSYMRLVRRFVASARAGLHARDGMHGLPARPNDARDFVLRLVWYLSAVASLSVQRKYHFTSSCVGCATPGSTCRAPLSLSMHDFGIPIYGTQLSKQPWRTRPRAMACMHALPVGSTLEPKRWTR